MKRKLFAILFAICLISCVLMVACGNPFKNDEKGTGMYWKIDSERTEFVFETGEKFGIPFVYVVDSLEDRVDGVETSYKVYRSSGREIKVKDGSVTFPQNADVCTIVYSANGMEDYELTCYVCEPLLEPEGFNLNGNVLTWDAVDGNELGKYAIKINGGNEQIIETTSFTSEIFESVGWYFEVKAIGDRVSTLDSDYSIYQKRNTLSRGELAAFNELNYVIDITTGTPNDASKMPNPIEFLAEEDCEGSTGGALKLGLKSGTYGHTIFRINLQNSFDTANIPETGGIEIRFKVDSKDYIYGGEVSPTRFYLSYPSDATEVQQGSYYLTDETNDKWLTLRIPARTSNLKGAYKEGFEFEHLQFNLYNMRRAGGYGELYLDYVRVYEDVLQTPVLVDNDGIISWDGIADACGYTAVATVESNGIIEEKTFELSQTSLDLSAYTQYYVSVTANSGVTYKVSSAYSRPLCKYATPSNENVIAEYNSVFYQGTVSETVGGYIYNNYNQDFVEKIEYDQSLGGVKITANTATSARHSPFRLTFTNGISLNDYSGIKIRFKLLSHPYVSETETVEGIRLYYVNANGVEDGNAGTSFAETGAIASPLITVGEWMEFYISSEDLAQYIEDGSNSIDLSVRRMGTTCMVNGKVEIVLGEISYYTILETPKNLSVTDKVLTWDAVDKATGYVIKFNGIEQQVVSTNSFDLTALIGNAVAYSVNVKAISSDIYCVESDYCQTKNVIEENGSSVASYNHEIYATMIEAFGPNDVSSSTYLTASQTDGHDGAIEFVLEKENVGFVMMFNLILPDALDLTGNVNGVKVKIRVKETSISGLTDLNLYYTKSTFGADQEYTVRDETKGFCLGTMTVGGEWVEFTITNTQLISYAYANADGKSTISLGVGISGQNMRNGTATIQIDYVQYV